MRKIIIFILIMGIPLLSLAKVGDILKILKSPSQCPSGLTFDGQYLWIADYHSDQIYKIDPETGKILISFPSPGFHPEGLAWDGKNLWHIDSKEKTMYKIDPETGATLVSLESNSSYPRDLAWDGKYIWIVDHKLDRLLKVSPEDGMMVQNFPTPSKEPAGLTFDGRYLWVTDREEDRLFLVNPEDGLCLSSLRSYGPYPSGLGWSDDGLWNVDYENDEIYKIKIFDADIMTRWDERQLNLEFIYEFHNYGPGTVKILDIYLPIPQNRDNQILISPILFNPQPLEIIEDRWNQKIAHFQYKTVKGYSLVKPSWRVKAKVYDVEYFLYPDLIKDLEAVPSSVRTEYTQDGDKYRISDPFIQQLAQRIAGNEKNPYWITHKIFNYLGNHLSYNLKPVGGWNPATTVLKRGTASCSEYSYCLIALCRALGVPARYIGAVSRRGDDASLDEVFHRWTEVYLPPYGWIPFDANKGDRELPGHQAYGIGDVDARYIVTTENGGGDRYLWFGYNYGLKWQTEGKCRIFQQAYGLWSPWSEKKYNSPLQPKE